MTFRTIPVQPLGHGSDCRICAAVDRWADAQRRRRPATKRVGDAPDLAGAGEYTVSRDAGPRRPSGPPDDYGPSVTVPAAANLSAAGLTGRPTTPGGPGYPPTSALRGSPGERSQGPAGA